MSKITPEQLRNTMINAIDGFIAEVVDSLEMEQEPSTLLPGQTVFKNLLTRTDMIRKLKIGDAVLVPPYTPGQYAREQASLKSAAVREGIHVELKKVTIIIEGELPQYFIRVLRTN